MRSTIFLSLLLLTACVGTNAIEDEIVTLSIAIEETPVANNLEYFGVGSELNYTLTPTWGASLSVRGAASGQNILASPSYSLGLFYDF